MTDPASPRSPKGWPLAAISLLILLLAGFLILKWWKKEEIPIILKEPPVPAQPIDAAQGKPLEKPGDSVKPVGLTPDKPDALPAEASAKAGEFDQRVKELKKALEAKNWDGAAAALDAARKLRADAAELKGVEDLIAEGRKKEEAELAERVRKAELKRKQEREWALVKEKVEKDSAADLWDGAIQSLDQIKKEYPEIDRDEDYGNTRKRITGFQADSDKAFKKDMTEAQKHFAEGRYAQAFATAESSLKYYPERKAIVREFQERVRQLEDTAL